MATRDPPNIRARKAAEARIEGIQRIQTEMQKTMVAAKFEESSNRMLKQRMASNKLEEAKAALEADLLRRRKK